MKHKAASISRIMFVVSMAIVILIASLVVSGVKANAQTNAQVGAAALGPNPTQVPALYPDVLVTSTEIINPYFTVKNLTLKDGTALTESIINGPSTPPDGYAAEQASVLDPGAVGAMALSDVPAFKWVFGCSAVSGSMVAGYYDRTGYSNMYTGASNGGIVPLAEDASWGSWSDGSSGYPNNPLIASHNGLDGRTTFGSIDDYWVQYGSSASDPYITGSWTQHAWGSAVGDYMKTSQSSYGNTDGATSFYGYGSSTKLACSAMLIGGYSQRDGTYGRKLFYEARGYTVTDCYYQATDNRYTGGFSLANFKAEIDAGRPVFLNLAGHSIVGVGYDPSSTTIYIHDTWDNSAHTMTWGGSYSGMVLQAASIVNLASTTPGPAAFTKSSPANGATGQATSLSLTWNATSPVTYYEYCYSTSPGCTNWTNAGNSTSVGFSGLSNSTTYYWQVRAWNGSFGPTAADGGNYWNFTTLVVPPAVPTGVVASDGTYTDRVRVSWIASTGATSYQVYRNTSNSSSGAALLASPSGSPYDDTSAIAGTTYWYFVTACNSAGCSGFSTSDSGSRAVVSLPGAFDKVAPANGTLNLSNKVTISWGSSAGATAYWYCYDTTNDNACSKWVNNGTSTSKTLTGLKKNTTYYWQVRAVNGAGTTYSNALTPVFWSFKTK